uniref:ZAD domain-containing protein n=1 Tax=Amphimedon queenslandica TaxID=400682 RepID=A0A1X7T126_AMPQE
MVAACFLCGEEIESRTQKAKKLLLFDRAGKKYLTVLNDVKEESFGSPLFDINEAGNSRDKTYICHSCCSSVDKLLSLRKKAEQEKSKVLQKLE